MITPKITRRLIVFNGKNDAPWALNRPDICVIYDIDAHDEPPFLAMGGWSRGRHFANGSLARCACLKMLTLLVSELKMFRARPGMRKRKQALIQDVIIIRSH